VIRSHKNYIVKLEDSDDALKEKRDLKIGDNPSDRQQIIKLDKIAVKSRCNTYRSG
jgi:hypothetical protein